MDSFSFFVVLLIKNMVEIAGEGFVKGCVVFS